MRNFTLAGFGTRLVAQIIDTLIVGVAMSLLIVPFFGLGGLTRTFDNDFAALMGGLALLPLLLIGLLGPMVYEIFMLSSARCATLGKSLMKIQVRDEFGNGLTIGPAIGRTLVKYLTFNFCFLLWLWPLFNKEEQALHDLIVRDFVIRD
jgi:uncharacterized RDD family membrane protein YckC